MTEETHKLRLTLRANKLTNAADVFKGTSDPYAMVTLGSGERDLGATEVIKNSLHPAWTESFLFDYTTGKTTSVTVKVMDKVTGDDPDKHMGSAVIEIGDGVKEVTKVLKDEGGKSSGKVFAHVSIVPTRSAGKLVISLKGHSLKKHFFHEFEHPYFEVRRTYGADEREWPIYRSKREVDSSEKFESASIDIDALCDGDLNRKIHVAVFEYVRNGVDETIGSLDTTVNGLIDSVGKKLQLKHGEISVDKCEIVDADPAPEDTSSEAEEEEKDKQNNGSVEVEQNENAKRNIFGRIKDVFTKVLSALGARVRISLRLPSIEQGTAEPCVEKDIAIFPKMNKIIWGWRRKK